jgi:hypothetical protein
MLDSGDDEEAVERTEQEEHDAVSGQPGGARDAVQRGGHIGGGVAPEEDRGREAEHRDHPGHEAQAGRGGEQPVPAQGGPRSRYPSHSSKSCHGIRTAQISSAGRGPAGGPGLPGWPAARVTLGPLVLTAVTGLMLTEVITLPI